MDARRSAATNVKYWEIISDNLSKTGFSWGCVSAIDSKRRTIWIAGAHRDNGKRFVVRADERLSAFLELESVISGSLLTSCNGAVGCGDASHRN
jgi:hypothetical protein